MMPTAGENLWKYLSNYITRWVSDGTDTWPRSEGQCGRADGWLKAGRMGGWRIDAAVRVASSAANRLVWCRGDVFAFGVSRNWTEGKVEEGDTETRDFPTRAHAHVLHVSETKAEREAQVVRQQKGSGESFEHSEDNCVSVVGHFSISWKVGFRNSQAPGKSGRMSEGLMSPPRLFISSSLTTTAKKFVRKRMTPTVADENDVQFSSDVVTEDNYKQELLINKENETRRLASEKDNFIFFCFAI